MRDRNFERELLPGAIRFSNEKDYWINKLSGDLMVSRFPCDYYRTGGGGDKTGASEIKPASVRFQLEKALFSKLAKISQNFDSRLFVLLVTGLMILLQKYTGHEDIIIGAPIDKQEIKGEYINTILALRSQVSTHMTIKEFLYQVRQTIVEACENQNYPLETISHELNLPVGKNDDFPLFDLAILLQNIHEKSYINHLKLNMIFSFSRTGEGLEGEVEYNPLLYKSKNIERIIGHLIHLLHKAFDNTGAPIANLEILTEKEKEHLLIEMNDTKAEYPGESTIHELFEMQAEKNPGNIAVEEADTSRFTSYKKLNESANQLSALLRERGTASGMIAAIMGERTLEIVIGILAILKSGWIYLPIDAQNPDERLKFMLSDSGAHIFLSQKHIIDRRPGIFQEFSPGKVIALDDENNYKGKNKNPGMGTRSTEPAYIIYTSGTTGKPKGVVLPHRSLVNYINFAKKSYVKDEPINFPLYSSIGFDLTVTSIFTPLVTGNTIVIYKGWSKGNLVEKIVDDNKVEAVKLTPSHLYLIKDKKIGKKISRIKRFIVGGEPLNPQLARNIHDNFKGNIEIYNEYGPTEAAVGCMLYQYNPQKDNSSTLPIGVPADNIQIYLLDKNLKPVPGGAIGELYVSGVGVAKGYLNQPQLTAEKFIEFEVKVEAGETPRRQIPGKHASQRSYAYRTGDLGRCSPDGNLEFLGRIDQQVKIRGFRIELGEIENKLLKYDDIKEAVVTPREDHDGNKYLCSYIVLSQGSPYNKPDSVSLLDIPGLKEYLAKELPDYMIPSYYVSLEKIPLNSNGKIDMKALPDPRGISAGNSVEYIPPGNIVEKELVEVWQKVLGRNDIGINHNFFMIGGDSIKSIQIMARMSSAGYKIEMRDLFQYPTISELAQKSKISDHIPDQNIITGTIPLTPIHMWFFENILTGRHHFNQAMMLSLKKEFDKEAVKAVFTKIQEHHDGLRMIFKKTNEGIAMVNQGLVHPLSLQVFDYRNKKNAIGLVESEANEIQASIDLETGPLMKLGLFYLDEGNRLLIVIHHLVIDGVSWRILLEDIETLYHQYKKGEALTLPLKTDSFKVWSEKLSQYANSDLFLKEKTYWAELESKQIQEIKKDFEYEDNYIKDVESVSFSLEETETHLLLTKVNEAFGTGINDILLTALGLAINRVYGNHQLLIAIEGHGREVILDGIDINRTIGWFTSIYPLVLDISFRDDLARQIKETKENLRIVPNNGIGYGILRYLTSADHKKNIDFKLNPRISFNYLGQFDSDLQYTSFSAAKEKHGSTISPGVNRTFEIDVSGIIANKCLMVTITYNKRHYKPETMKTFGDNYKIGLRDTISYCLSRKVRELTPSDLTYPGFSIEKVEQLAKQYAIEDIYILTPMQEGKLFYTLYDQSTPGGSVQIKIAISGKLNLSLFERSINELFERYDILRAIFVYEEVKVPIQIILKKRQVNFLYQDLRGKITDENKQSIIDEFAERDRMRSFDLRKDVLMRTSVLQTGDSDYEVIWSFHHILMDGWCLGILFEEFLKIYHHLGENKPYQLPPVTPFREYIRWFMKQDQKKPEAYWKKYLEGYDRETNLLKKKEVKKNQKGYQFQREPFDLSEDKTSALHLLAARSQVTLNTIIQAVWGILLSKYNREEDVVFGAVVSGRPSEIPGVESMVGLFINTIPVRMSLKRGITFRQLVLQVQEKAIESEPYHYYPLSRIQSASILKRNLLDHILVFENYPLVEQVEGIAEKTQNKAFDVLKVTEYTQPDYNFHVVIFPGNSIGIEFRYNSLAYDRNFVKKIALHVEEVVDTILADQEVRLEDIQISDERTRAKSSDQNNYTADFGF